MKKYTLMLAFGLLVLLTTQVCAQAPVAKLALSITDTHRTNNITPLASNSTPLKTDDVVGGLPPHIVYPTPQVYAINQPIPALHPTNTGGPVLATSPYGNVITIANYFSQVTGVAVDASGNIFVADFGDNQIKKVTTSGVLSVFAGSYSGGGSTNGYGNAASFYTPDALVFDQSGNLFIADNGNSMIRKITSDGLVSTFAGSTTLGRTDGTGSSASFNYPRGMVFDAAGNLFVADQGNNLIRKITPAGVVSTYAGNGNFGFTNGQRLSASFNTPTAVAIDAAGNLYVSDASNNAIRKIAPDGTVSTFVSGLNFPRELRFDADGNLYVNDMNSYSVKKISPTGAISTIAGSGSSGYADGIGINATFSRPIGMDRDGNGDLLIGDGSLIRKISLSGYSIDKALPAGLIFDGTTGVISGTPTVLSASTAHTITAFNGYGSSTTVVNIAVATTSSITNLLPSIITLPPQQPGMLGADNYYDPQATSTNNETPITFTTSDPSIAYITPDGRIKVLKPGTITLTAYQAGNADYSVAASVTQQVNIVEYLAVYLPPISNTLLCSHDFNANGLAADNSFPMSYTSSNPSVATVDNNGNIHITGTGTTTITLSQQGQLPLYVSAPPQSQTFTVTAPVVPSVGIAVVYQSPCFGSPATFTAISQNSGNAPAYQWQVNGINSGSNSATFSTNTLADGDKVSCIITNTDNACISTYTSNSNLITVTRVTPSAPTVSITASTNEVFPGTPIKFTATVNSANGVVTYQWLVNGVAVGTNNPVFSSSTLSNNDVVSCAITPSALCSTPAVSNQIRVIVVTQVSIPNTFTPNGDGINDKWNISGIGSYPYCLVNVYNRYGKLVYQSTGYQQAWDGTISGAAVPVSTYYYVINLGIKNRIISGYVTVLR